MKLGAAIWAFASGRTDDGTFYISLRDPPAHLADRFAELQGYCPEIHVEALRTLPEGTFGRAHAAFLDATGLRPFTFSEALREESEAEPYTLRSVVTHDLHHVLAGFDTGLAGELGLLAFLAGQGMLPRFVVLLSQLFGSLLSPSQALRIHHNVRVGATMGARARVLAGERLEDHFARPLAELRAEYNLPDPKTSGVRPSLVSWLLKLVAPRVNPV